MAELKVEEIRRLLSYLRDLLDEETFSRVEDDLSNEMGEVIIREPEFLEYFSVNIVEIENWRLKIIPYTAMRMIQRGVKLDSVVNIFRRFIEYYRSNDEAITVGKYSILDKINKKTVTLRIDIDRITDETGDAHTVTIFFGYGNAENTIFLSLEQ